MAKRPDDSSKKPSSADSTDTRSYEHVWGEARNKSTPEAANPKMPHERDESARSTGNRMNEQVPPSKRQISQAHDDVESGQVDTDRRGVPDDVPTDKR
jgi:hypothetical protein